METTLLQLQGTKNHESVTPPSTMDFPPILDGGIAIAVLVFLLKEGLSFLKKKDSDESQLTSQLIQDLRSSYQNQLSQLNSLLIELKTREGQHEKNTDRIAQAVIAINTSIQQGKETELSLLTTLSKQAQVLILLEQKISAIYAILGQNTREPQENNNTERW